VRFEVFTAMTMKNTIFWDVAPCRYLEAIRSSETSVNKIPTWHHIPEDGILHFFLILSLKKWAVTLYSGLYGRCYCNFTITGYVSIK
jgi:hypothetical protein